VSGYIAYSVMDIYIYIGSYATGAFIEMQPVVFGVILSMLPTDELGCYGNIGIDVSLMLLPLV
jgi:hypothetical protein